MKKGKVFGLLWSYLKHDKFKLIMYILLVLLTYLPAILSAFFWGKALELLIIKDINGFFTYLGIWSILYIIFYSILQIPRESLYNELELKFTEDVSRDLYKKIDALPAKAFEDMGVGEFINRLYSDPDRIMQLLAQLIKLTSKSLVVIVVLVMSFNISWILGFEIVLLGIIMGIISFNFFPKIKAKQKDIKKESDEYVKIATENITGIREIKALGIKKNIETKVFTVMNRLFGNTKKIRKYEVVYGSLNNLTYFILQFVILFTAGYFFIEGRVTYAVFMIIESYIWRVDEVVENISTFGVNYNKIAVSLGRIDEIINNKLYKDEAYGTTRLDNSKGLIEFKNVKFKYSENEDLTLKGLNLTIEPNKKIAIIGRSGNGKSTIFNLLLRYFDTTRGKILIDGINILDLTEDSLRKNISIIRQSPFLFNLSILDNFKLVKDCNLDAVRKVCKRAYIDDYIMGLPEQYNTVIGEGGINLSGGQKQRIAIARTLLLNSKIILFDEATSALDNESQEYIKKTIDNLVKDHTIIIVAHRLSTIIDADIINVIDNGALSASGTHEELLMTNNVYKSLYTTESSNS